MLKIFIILLSTTLVFSFDEFYSPKITTTRDEIWPRPRYQTQNTLFSVITSSVFRFEATNNKCDLLEQAFRRYKTIIDNLVIHIQEKSPVCSDEEKNSTNKIPNCLKSLQVNLTEPCAILPELDMDESYNLLHTNNTAVLNSKTIWGILRGLESFSQMLVFDESKRWLTFRETKIDDQPRFSHRGLLIDTARHYLSIQTIYRILDGMAYNKLNVLHWHIVDDQSFPYVSIAFPELSQMGAYHKTMTYTPANISSIIEYARVRGIRVLPEFDVPGHTSSWGKSHPELLTICSFDEAQWFGILDPTKQQTYDLLYKLLTEIVALFPEKYVHLGGDEVNFKCWKTKEHIKRFMEKKKFECYKTLEDYFFLRVTSKLTQLNASSIVWQEVFSNGVSLPQSTVVQLWKGDKEERLSSITLAGYNVVTSHGWYLDHLQKHWIDYYLNEPLDFDGTEKQKKMVLGGEACMWGEYVDDTNVLQTIFPRVSAVAERLWSYFDESDETIHDVLHDAKRRIREHTCRMIFRGIPSSPSNGPDFCVL